MFSALLARSGRAQWLPSNSVIRWIVFALFFAQLPGCFQRAPKQLGNTFTGKSVPVSVAKRADHGSPTVLQGRITEKCPEAGCWFVLQDQSGAIKVDTRDAGFVVVDVPLHVSLSVAGRVETNGVERVLKATGLRY